jgi:hypothetical protein
MKERAKGKSVCHAGQCDFLIATPVKSVDSGDSNCDLHMIEATRGAQFPMVVVRTLFPEAEVADASSIPDVIPPNAAGISTRKEDDARMPELLRDPKHLSLQDHRFSG